MSPAGNAPGERSVGAPTSSNGASSLHLGWVLPEVQSGGFREVSVTLEVLQAPRVDQLYFWALQADFADGAGRGPVRRGGGAHLGLQWHPQHPGSTAVNWGGYGPNGGELSGSNSALPSALHNVNTRDFRWREGVKYRLSIARVDPVPVDPAAVDHAAVDRAEVNPAAGGDPARERDGLDPAAARSTSFGPDGFPLWRGSVTDADGTTTIVRDLYAPGDRISGAIMWSEVFARCDDPTARVGWSEPMAIALDGTVVRPERVSVNYQSRADGGCTNTDSRVDGVAIVQSTNAERTTRQGAALAVPVIQI